MTDPADNDLLTRLRAIGETLRGLTADMQSIDTKLQDFDPNPAIPLRTWPKPGPPRFANRPDQQRPPPTEWNDDQLWARWQQGGVEWLLGADLGTRRALVRAISSISGERFVRAPRLIGSLLPLLRTYPRMNLAATLYFSHYPPPKDLFEHDFTTNEARRPAWWAKVGPNLPSAERMVAAIGRMIQTGEVRLREDLEIRSLHSDWEKAIVSANPPTNTTHARALLHFLDGKPIGEPENVRDAVALALRAWVSATERGAGNRREVGHLLSQRVGSPFGGDAGGRWTMVPELLPKVRAWLVGEVLEAVFEHLRPRESAHQLQDRKNFWKGYTGNVLRLWVLVSDSIKKRGALNHPDVQKVREAMGFDFRVRELEGGSEQALVWMQLQGHPGSVVTVIEGNADTTLRIYEGSHEPKGKTVNYSKEVVGDSFGKGVRALPGIRHQGRWQDKAEDALAQLGVFPS